MKECGEGAVTDAERATLELWSGLVRVTDAVRASLSAELSPEYGLAPEDIELLMRLAEQPEQRLRMAEVSRSLVLSKSGATRLVDRLAERGLVERAACPEDRRVVYAGLTPAGRDALREAAPALRAGLVAHLGRHLDARESKSVRAALDRVLLAETGV